MDALQAITTIVQGSHFMNTETCLGFVRRVIDEQNPDRVLSEWRMAEEELSEDQILNRPRHQIHNLDTVGLLSDQDVPALTREFQKLL